LTCGVVVVISSLSIRHQPKTKPNPTMQNIKIKAVDQLREATENGCTFVSFLYTTKGTQETSKYVINFGIDYRSAVADDKKTLEAYVPKNDLEIQAKDEMLQSLNETLTEGVSSSYTQKETFENIGKGIKQHTETGEIYIYGYVHDKQTIEPAKVTKAPVNSRPLTLAKKDIEKACNFKRSKFAQFKLDPSHIAGIVAKGDHIEII